MKIIWYQLNKKERKENQNKSSGNSLTFFFFTVVCVNFFLFNLFILFILFLAALSLRCCTRAFSSCSERGLLFVAVCGLTVVASLVVEHGL